MQTIRRGYSRQEVSARWEEALLCGNGTVGALLLGQPHAPRVIFTHEKLFLPRDARRPPVVTADHLPQMREMLRQGQFRQVAELVVALAQEQGYTGMHWTDSFFPACELALELPAAGPIAGYNQSLDYTEGLATVAWQDARGSARWRGFVSRADGVAVLQLSASDGAALSCTLELRHVAPGAGDSEVELARYRADFAPPEIQVEENWLYFGGRFGAAEGGYDCLARVVVTGGQSRVEGTRLRIDAAAQVLLLVQLLPAAGDDRRQRTEMQRQLADLPPDFDTLLARHAAIHTALYGRTTLSLGSTPEAAHLQQLFDAGRYEILSSCGEWPPNLQGVWTGIYDVPWSSDYTVNGNAQTAVTGLLPGNLPECLDSYLRYMEFLVPDAAWNAEALYGCRGILLSSRSSSHGLNNHFSVGHPHTLWTAGAAWAAHFFYEYWLYTCDDEFFLRRALPYMKEVALFYEDFLVEDADGHWFFSPSYSPENTPRNSDNSASVNATMDIAIARELFNNLLEGCRTLGVEQEDLARWERMLSKMPPYLINEDGAVKEWCDTRLADQYDHRHASHLYPLMYGIAPELAQDEQLLAAFAQAYKLRLRGRDKEAGIMAFGSIQLAQAAVHLRDTETVWSILQELAAGYYYANFATSHDMGPHIFNADLSGGLPALLLECLVQSRPLQDADGRIASYRLDILPVLPPAWDQGAARGVLARGGFVLDFAWHDGKLASLTVHNAHNRQCTVHCEGRELPLIDHGGKLVYTAPGESVTQ
jgi:hypothetical protein